MRKHTKVLVFGLFLASTSHLGCENSSEPVGRPLILSLEIVQTTESLIATATVTNVGRHSVTYPSGCGMHVGLAVLDSHETRLRLSCGPEIGCPFGYFRLSPGETRTGTLLFEGETCIGGELGSMQPVAPGQYRVVASFDYISGNERQLLEEIREFTWDE